MQTENGVTIMESQQCMITCWTLDPAFTQTIPTPLLV